MDPCHPSGIGTTVVGEDGSETGGLHRRLEGRIVRPVEAFLCRIEVDKDQLLIGQRRPDFLDRPPVRRGDELVGGEDGIGPTGVVLVTRSRASSTSLATP